MKRRGDDTKYVAKVLLLQKLSLCFLVSLNIAYWCIMTGTTVSINGLPGSRMDSRDVSVGGLLHGSLSFNFIKRILVLKILWLGQSKGH